MGERTKVHRHPVGLQGACSPTRTTPRSVRSRGNHSMRTSVLRGREPTPKHQGRLSALHSLSQKETRKRYRRPERQKEETGR